MTGGGPDPLRLVRRLWPHVSLYDKQKEILYSVWDDDETVVVAGNMLGKDFVAGLAVLAFFLTRHPCRVVTTSADHSQLEAVLWGEIRRFVATAAHPLELERGGPLAVNHLHLRKLTPDLKGLCGVSYAIGRVAQKGEGLLGHHVADTGDGVPRTLFVCDEASGVEDLAYERADTWARRKLVIGNPYPCANFFKWAVQGRPDGSLPGGDLPRASGAGYHRRVIRVRGEDSPNVRLALSERRKGLPVTGEVVVPGVLPWADYERRRLTWDPARQAAGLDAEWWEGRDQKLFPVDWLTRAESAADRHEAGRPWGRRRRARAVGVDPAEGGDRTAMCAVDEWGVIDLVSRKTPNTDDVPREAIAFWQAHGCDPADVVFDRGGGGKQHADRLRAMGHPVRTVAFGESAAPDPREAPARRQEDRSAYKNRRAEMYGTLRGFLDPGGGRDWGVPRRFAVLRQQLAPIPLVYDAEGRLELPPKNRKAGSGVKALVDVLGGSPDEADALVLALHGMAHKAARPRAGAVW